MVPYSVRLCGCTKVDKEAEILSVTMLVDTKTLTSAWQCRSCAKPTHKHLEDLALLPSPVLVVCAYWGVT